MIIRANVISVDDYNDMIGDSIAKMTAPIQNLCVNDYVFIELDVQLSK